MANTSHGSSREELAKIYNIGDLYVQYSVAGALEIPIIESKACGVPVVSVEYAAPYELARLGGGYGQVSITGWKQESIRETSQIRAVPNDKELEQIIESYLKESDEKKKFLSQIARQTALDYHSSDDFAKKWETLFDAVKVKNPFRWFSPPSISQYININSNGSSFDPISACMAASEFFTQKTMQSTTYQMCQISDVMNMNAASNNSIDLQKLNGITNTEISKRNQYESSRFSSSISKIARNDSDKMLSITI